MRSIKDNNFVLRISVTSSCNLKCSYCIGSTLKGLKNNMNDDEILEIIESAVNNGVKKISWTGGEPTVRKNILSLVSAAKKMGIKKQTMTTNGVLLYKMLPALKKAGINRFNISLDTLNPDKYKFITKRDCLNDVIKSINRVVEIYDNTKINCVVTKDNFNEIEDLVNFIEQYEGKLKIRFLELIPCGEAFGHNPDLFKKEFVSIYDVLRKLKRFGELKIVENTGNVPKSIYFKIEGLKGIYGVNPNKSASYACDRKKCPKIRVSPNGYVSNCTIKIEHTRKLSGKSKEEKNELMKKIVKEKLNRNFNSFRHKQKYYNFWRFGIISEEVRLKINEK